MATTSIVNPMGGVYNAFYLLIPQIGTFLTSDGWTVHVATATSNADILLRAEKAGVAFQWTANGVAYMNIQAGTTFSGGGTVLVEPSAVYSLHLFRSYNGYDGCYNLTFDLVSNGSHFWITTSPHADYPNWEGTFGFGVGTYTPYGTVAGSHIYLICSNPYSLIGFMSTSYVGQANTTMQLMTGDQGSQGNAGYMWSSTASGEHHSTGTATNAYSYLAPSGASMAIPMIPFVVYVRDATGFSVPVGYVSILSITGYIQTYPPGTLFSHNSNQYMSAVGYRSASGDQWGMARHCALQVD